MKTLIIAAIRCSLIFLIPTITHAITAKWDLDPLSNNWNTAANWTPDTVPGAVPGRADIATFGFTNLLGALISEDIELKGIVFTKQATIGYVIAPERGKTLTISGPGITNNSPRQQSFVSPGGRVGNFNGGSIKFTNDARAGINNSFLAEGGQDCGQNCSGHGGIIEFSGTSHAGHSIFGASKYGFAGAEGGSIIFSDTSHAGSAVLYAGTETGNHGGTIFFKGASDGERSQISIFNGGTLDLREHNGSLTIGSIEGDGSVVFGDESFTLYIGGNNLDTTFSGDITLPEGSNELHKVGSGRLTLSGTIEVPGDTDIEGGVLQIDGSLDGTTIQTVGGSNASPKLAGTGTITASFELNIASGSTIAPGRAGALGELTVGGGGNYLQSGTLIIRIASDDEFSVLNLEDADLQEDSILAVERLNDFMPTPGHMFNFLSYNNRRGCFSRIENKNFGDMHWQICYDDEQGTAFLRAVGNPEPACPEVPGQEECP